MINVRVNPESVEMPFKKCRKYLFGTISAIQYLLGVYLFGVLLSFHVNRIVREGWNPSNTYHMLISIIPTGIFFFVLLPLFHEYLIEISKHNNVNSNLVKKSFIEDIRSKRFWRLCDVKIKMEGSICEIILTFEDGLLYPCIDVILPFGLFEKIKNGKSRGIAHSNDEVPSEIVVLLQKLFMRRALVKRIEKLHRRISVQKELEEKELQSLLLPLKRFK